jgi:hypothetical protein
MFDLLGFSRLITASKSTRPPCRWPTLPVIDPPFRSSDPDAQTEHRSKFIPTDVRYRAGINFARRSVRRGGTKEVEMLRVSFSTMTTARAAVNALEAYGYSAQQSGCDVVTDCPTLLAIPAIQKRVGFGRIERLDLSGATSFPESTAEFFPASSVLHAEQRSERTA